MRYENWHKHTHYSNIFTIDSLIKPEDIARRAIELGHKTLSTVEHGYAGNVFEYYDVAKKYGLKLIFGVEFYYVVDRFEKDRTNAHLLIMAKTNEGRRQLTKLISEANLTGYYHRPRIDRELLFSLNPKDVVVTSTCIASPYNLYDDECFITDCYEYFGENFFLEIHDNTNEKQVKYNRKLLKLHEKYNIPLVHATDTHYIYPEDNIHRDDLLKGKGVYYPEEDGFVLDYPDSDTIFQRYERQGVFTKEQVESALKNTWIVDDFEEIEMNKEIKMPSLYPKLTHEEKIKKLKQIITKEWQKDKKELSTNQIKDHIEAIRFETKIIEETKMEDYFLLNYEVIKRAKEKGGILTRTGRGSAPSFYVNKLLGFTEIDRLEAPITLYPTRFMSKSRILETKSLPDIDFNTADPKPFIEATKELLGEDNCYYMVAYGTMQESEAFRNLCRAKKIDYDTTNKIAKDLDKYKDDPEWKDLINDSKKFIGVIDSVSPHPCANLILDKPISEEIGLIRTGDGKNKEYVYCALIDSDTSDDWKYLKNDYLTVTVWEIISKVYKEINKPIDSIRELIKKTENDEKVWSLYEKGLTATLNQTGTNSGTPQVMRYKPKNIRELSGWVSAIRPQFQSMKDYFLDRKPFSYNIPEFDDILKESDNFILYQENIMATLVFAGFPEDETYGLLKQISRKKKGVIEKIENKFIEGFVKQTGSENKAREVWKIIQDAVGYGFNSSHAYSVALDSLYGAYLKAYYPLEYYSVVLNIYQNNAEITAKLHKELDYFKIKIRPIKFGKSLGEYTPSKKDNSIYKGLASIKYLNRKIADELMELSKNKYETFTELLIDIHEKTSVNSRQLDILIRLNFFEQFGSIERLLAIYDNFINGEYKYKKTYVQSTKDKRIPKLIKWEKETDIIIKFPIADQIKFQKEVLGYAELTLNVPKSHCIVLDINSKYTPVVTLYQLNTGREIRAKIKKKTFFTNHGELCAVGDYVEILNTFQDYKWKRDEDGKFYQDKSEKELFVDSLRHIK